MGKRFTLDLPPEVRAFYAEASARRERVDTPCASCGKVMQQVLKTARYCSPACTQRAYRQRKRAAERADAGVSAQPGEGRP